MIVSLQTRFSKPQVLFDTNAPASQSQSSGFGKAIVGLLRPYVVVKEGSYTMYEYGKPYPDESLKYQFVAGVFGLGLLAGLGAGVYKIGKAISKV